jgi:NitT/TauT family transport system substrate-binding protein
MVRSSLAGIAGVALLLSLVGAEARAENLEKITFLTPAPSTLPSFAAAQLAKGKDYFKAEGLDVEIMTGKGGADVAKQIGAGNADAGYIVGDAPILVRSNGVPVKLVAMFGGGGFSFLVAREDSGIKSPADLKGKTVGVMTFEDTATYYTLLGAIASVGLKRSDVDIQAMGPTATWQSVATGKAPACSCVADWITLIRATGTKIRVIRYDEIFPAVSQGIGVSDRSIKERPKMVAGLVRALLKGAQEMRSNPDQAAEDFVKFVPGWKGKEAGVKATMHAYASLVYVGQKKFGEVDGARLGKLQDFYLEQKVIKAKTPVGELYTNQFVK